MTRVTITGAAGRMGQMLVRGVWSTPGLELAGAVETPGHARLGEDAGVVAGVGRTGVTLGADLRAALAAADALIDFTFHAAVPANARVAADAGKAVVIGTTGLDAAESDAVRAASRVAPVVWAPNMSLGVNLLFALVQQAAAVLGPEYDVEIVEVHHRHKQDAPSGTALRLGEKVAAGRRQDFRSVAVFGREGITGERPAGQIGIHALRMADVVGEHTVAFGAEGERLELSHRASSRSAFAQGALRAAVWACGRPAGLYDMQDVLGLRAAGA